MNERGFIGFSSCADDPNYKRFSFDLTLVSGPLDWGFQCVRCGDFHMGRGEEEMKRALEGSDCG